MLKKMKDPKKMVIKIVVLTVIGVILALAGIIQYFFMPSFVKYMVKKNLILTPHSSTYSGWQLTPIPIYTRIYMFNITNTDDILDRKSSPLLEELGPYTFREEREKINLTWNENGTVTYKQVKRYYYLPELSNGMLNDTVYHLNIPMVSAGNAIKRMSGDLSFLYSAIEELVILSQSNLFLKHSVGELLFNGYDDDLLYVGSQLQISDAPITDKFGFFYNRNDTSNDGTYEVYTGSVDINKFGKMASWNYKPENTVWENRCNQLNDTFPGEFQPPFAQRSNKIKIFNGELCRPLILTYEKDIEYRDLKLSRYIIDESMFNYNIEENKCYCQPNKCPTNGVLDLSPCSHGAPMALSLPHFLYADKKYIQIINGLKPNKERHEFYMDIEPNLGVAIRTNARMQLNVVFQRNEHLFFSSNSTQKETYYPQFWTHVNAEVDDDKISSIVMLINKVPYFISIGSFILIFIGGLLLNCSIMYAIRMKKNLLSNSPSSKIKQEKMTVLKDQKYTAVATIATTSFEE